MKDESLPHREATWAALMILASALLLRLPYFFPSVIDWDESTLILMGQGLLDGLLPYRDLWDLKPPLAFAAFAGSIAVFGKSIAGIRLAGTLCVAAAAFGAYVVARPVLGFVNATAAGLLTTIGIVSQQAGQATMTEHFAIVPLVYAWVLLAAGRLRPPRLFLIGGLLGIATLIRTNLGFVAVAVSLAVMLRPGSISWQTRGREVVVVANGGLLVLIITLLPYLVRGENQLVFDSLGRAPFAYASSQHSVFGAVKVLACAAYYSRQPIKLLLWVLGAWGVIRLTISASKLTLDRWPAFWTLIFLTATTISILLSGAAYPHYLIQAVPFCIVSIGYAVFFESRKQVRGLILAVLAMAVILAFRPIADEYFAATARLVRGEHLASGRAYALAGYLAAENPHGAPVYLLSDHIAYWLTDTWPLSRMSSHPSNVERAGMLVIIEGPGATPLSEVQRIMRRKPVFVVKPEEVRYFRHNPEVVAWLDSQLAAHYAFIKNLDGLQIYRRVAE